MSDLIIRTPGKFEGEPRWVPYFWDLALEGEGEISYPDAPYDPENPDEDTTEGANLVTYFSVSTDDVDKFPELGYVDDVWIWEDSQGFVIALTDRDAVAAYFGIDRAMVVPCNVG